MTEHPILFNGAMVRAILAGLKTQTRRIVKNPDKCPYGSPGDGLWVRETWTETDDEYGTPIIVYRADMTQQIIGQDENGYELLGTQKTEFEVDKWKPSIFMPKWASRLKLKVADIWQENLNQISETDAQAEGIETWKNGFYKDYEHPGGWRENPIHSYQTLWDSINKKRGFGWDTNPLVWAVKFDVTGG